MSEAVLRLEGIEKGYKLGRPGEVRVLRGASLSIAQGEVVALVAPSGAGKSTLLHIAGLLDTPDAGRVAIGGQDLTRANDSARTAARRSLVGVCLPVPPSFARVQRGREYRAATIGRWGGRRTGARAGRGAFGGCGPVRADGSSPRRNVGW